MTLFKSELFIRPIVQNIEPHFEVDRMLLTRGPVANILCRNGHLYDYSSGVADLWNVNSMNLFIVEHDIIPTKDIINELSECSYPLCVPLYRTNSVHTGLDEEVIPHRNFEIGKDWNWIQPGISWADTVGFGCVKFHKLARQEVSPTLMLNMSWKQFDSFLSKRITDETGFRWHVHQSWVKHKQTDVKNNVG